MYYLYSKSCEYAIRILTLACREGQEECFSVRKMCKKANVPEPYTRKALQGLVKAEILKPLRGPGGGYQLVMLPKKISILQLVEAIDGHEAFEQCVMGLPECGNHKPCPLHDAWTKVKDKYIVELKRKTLYDLMKAST